VPSFFRSLLEPVCAAQQSHIVNVTCRTHSILWTRRMKEAVLIFRDLTEVRLTSSTSSDSHVLLWHPTSMSSVLLFASSTTGD
jgi:hypothetical protein